MHGVVVMRRHRSEVIDLVSSESEDEASAARNDKGIKVAGGKGRSRKSLGLNGSAPPPPPPIRSATSSPVSTGTTTSNNPLATLLYSSRQQGVAAHKAVAKGGGGGGGPSKTKSKAAGAAETSKPRGKRKTTAAVQNAVPVPVPLPVPLKREMWTTVHEPQHPEDLIIHKKKVDEVRVWLELQLTTVGQPGVGKLLMVTGPPGCGKTATLRVLGESMGFTIVEWQAQAEASYQEIRYLHSGFRDGSGFGEEAPQYVSKLAAFEEFADGAKMPALQLISAPKTAPIEEKVLDNQQHPNHSKARPTLVFIDDLPFVGDSEQRRRVAQAVSNLARSTLSPVVLFSTEASGRSKQDQTERTAPGGLPKEVMAALEAVGSSTISFNPITDLNCAKVLRKVLQAEHRALPEAHIIAIATQSGGDLRNAINSLQFACTGAAPVALQPPAKRARGTGKKKITVPSNSTSTAADVESVTFMLRDASLGLFHGLGKLLHNRRLPVPSPSPVPQSEERDFDQIADVSWTYRAPMDGFDPEAVLFASGLESGSVAAFLHENILDYVDDSSIDDLAACLAQLSTADVMASGGRRRHSDALATDDVPGGSTITEVCAANVAARGVCFWNTHPAPKQFRPMRAPALYTVQRGINANSEQLRVAAGLGRVFCGGSGGLDSASVVATDILPTVRSISQQLHGRPGVNLEPLIYQQPPRWKRYWSGKLLDEVLHAGVKQNKEQLSIGGVGASGSAPAAAAAAVWEEEDPIESSSDEYDDW